jgi:uncharacterized protein (DUF1810 family)
MNDLSRFLQAQASTYDGVVAELRAGRKTGHWIWWIFPQLRGLGFSRNSDYYGIVSLAEAKQYADHPVLDARLRECVQLVLDAGTAPERVLGDLDAAKLRSCLSLFNEASSNPELFATALERMYSGIADPATIRLLNP